DLHVTPERCLSDPPLRSSDLMPQMDGIEVMRLLAERRTSARLVILSGVGTRVLDAAHRVAAEKGLRILGVLPKPIRAARLREVRSEEHTSALQSREKLVFRLL